MNRIDESGLLTGRPSDEVPGAADTPVGEGQSFLGGSRVVGDRCQRSGVELVAQCRQRLLGRRHAGGELDHVPGQPVEPAGCVDDQVTQLLERVTLSLQFLIGLRGGDDHPGQKVTALLGRLGHRVVEDLTHIERLGQCLSRIADRPTERLRPGVAEFLDSQSQFAFAGAHGVVDINDDGFAQVVERIDGHRCQRAGIGGIHSPGRGEIGLTALGSPPPHPQPHYEHRDAQYCHHGQERGP